MSHRKVIFALQQDDDGYPPVEFEGLWGNIASNGNLILDSIPFYVPGISLGDEIKVKSDSDNEFWFESLVVPSGNSTFRVLVVDESLLDTLRSQIDKLGCRTEVDKEMGLIAINIPAVIEISPVLDFLMSGQSRGEFDFEEAALRHTI